MLTTPCESIVAQGDSKTRSVSSRQHIDSKSAKPLICLLFTTSSRCCTFTLDIYLGAQLSIEVQDCSMINLPSKLHRFSDIDREQDIP